MEGLADTLILELVKTPWRDLLIHRLVEAAYLMDCQGTLTFRNLAATEAQKLTDVTDPKQLLTGFTRSYGRRCITEELLRLRSGSMNYDHCLRWWIPR